MRARVSPGSLFLASVLIGIAIAVGLVGLATQRPWLGLALQPDPVNDTLRIVAVAPGGAAESLPKGAELLGISVAGGAQFPLRAQDGIEEPDVIESYAVIRDFHDRQSHISGLLQADTVVLHLRGGEGAELPLGVTPLPQRPVTDLPMAFWVQVFVGLAGFWIGVWVWSLRRNEAATRYLVLAGIGLMLSAFAAAVYSTRELAIGGELFAVLSAVNHGAALLFGVGMIGLFLSYPVRLAGGRWHMAAPMILGVWFLLNLAEAFPGPPQGFHLPVALAMLTILVLVGFQYRATAGNPGARAALRWFGLSVAVGAGAFVLTIIVPNLVGSAPQLSQGYAFLFFLLIYVGLALGVRRYRLFELEVWSFRILFYLSAVAVLIVLDAALIYVVALDRVPAFGLSLLAVAFVYLPLRDVLARWLMGEAHLDRVRLFASVVDVALTPPGDNQAERWKRLLTEIFEPLDLRADPEGPNELALADDGQALVMPGVGHLAPLRLEYAQRGRRLFSLRDLAIAGELVDMLRHAMESRDSFESGVREERERIARDMHDNIGVQLMGALHSKEVMRKNRLIRETLGDLRDIINNASGDGLALPAVLADLRGEIAEHAATAGITLDWRVDDTLPSVDLDPRLVHALRSILREATGNVIRHAGAQTLSISVRGIGDALEVHIDDDGRGLKDGPDAKTLRANGGGNGLANMQQRIAALGGGFEIGGAAQGTRIRARIPLKGEAAH